MESHILAANGVDPGALLLDADWHDLGCGGSVGCPYTLGERGYNCRRDIAPRLITLMERGQDADRGQVRPSDQLTWPVPPGVFRRERAANASQVSAPALLFRTLLAPRQS